jgi:hydrogenase maturation protease
VEVGPGSRVVLRPGAGADIFDRAIAGKVGVVDRVDEDMEGGVQLAVVVEDDPGRDLGEMRQPGHRFFFSPEEVEPLAGQPRPPMRLLVAGIGNIFMGDDAFGVEVARRLAERDWPAGVDVRDFGIRGMDLMYALGEGYDAAVFVDAVPRGERPGTVSLIEPDPAEGHATLDAHGMDPVRVLALARQLGPVPERILIVGCEPAVRMSGAEEELVGELSEPVRAAIGGAVELVESVVSQLLGNAIGAQPAEPAASAKGNAIGAQPAEPAASAKKGGR